MTDKVVFNKDFYDEQWRHSWKARFMYDPISKRKIAQYLLQRVGFVDGRKNVLDVGFGFGLILFTFDHSDAISGVELADSAVDYAKTRAQQLGYHNPDFRSYAGDGAIPFDDASYDLVVCSHVLEHVPNDEFLLREIKRLMKPNGIALLNIPINEEHFADPRHMRKYTPSAFTEMLLNTGFEVVESYQGDRLWNTFGWFFEKDYHNRIPLFGFLISSCLNITTSLLPFRFQKWVEEVFLQNLPPRQFAVCVKK